MPELRQGRGAAGEGRFQALEAGRGIAAAMVALSHALSLCAEPRWLGVVPFGGRLANMNVGVDFFFVLSGFVVTFVHWGDLGRPERLGRYARRRFVRVFPPYWIVLAAIVPVYLAVPSFGEPRQHDWLNIATSALLLPMPEQPVLGVAWTLTYELFFYAMLGAAIRFGRRAVPLFGLWIAVIVACQLAGLHDYPLSFLANAYCLEFLAGLGVAAGLRRGRMPLAGAAATAGLAGFGGLALLAPGIQLPADGSWARLLFGGSAALAVAGLVELERSGRLRVPAWLAPLGAASYAIYLSHVVTESALIRLGLRLGIGAAGPQVLALLLAAAGIAGGIAYHVAVERPATAYLRRRLG